MRVLASFFNNISTLWVSWCTVEPIVEGIRKFMSFLRESISVTGDWNSLLPCQSSACYPLNYRDSIFIGNKEEWNVKYEKDFHHYTVKRNNI